LAAAIDELGVIAGPAHHFDVTNSELREEYLAAVLEIHDSPEAKMTGVTR
jgi:hypothetical protein